MESASSPALKSTAVTGLKDLVSLNLLNSKQVLYSIINPSLEFLAELLSYSRSLNITFLQEHEVLQHLTQHLLYDKDLAVR